MGAGQSQSTMTSRLELALVLAMMLAESANAQAPNASVGATVETAATALGMVRGVGRRMDSINTVEFSGRGTLNVPGNDGEWTRYEITEATVGISYSIPAMRWDMTRVGTARSSRAICVVRDDRGWNERLPGVDPVEVEASDPVRCRLEQIWLTPHGFMTSVVHNPEAVALGALRQVGLVKQLRVGWEYTVEYHPARNGDTVGLMTAITLPNGNRLLMWNVDPALARQ